MLRALITLLLAAAAFGLVWTKRGDALLGNARNGVAAGLAVLVVLQGYRVVSARVAQRRADAVRNVPKRPLGLDDPAD